MYVCDGGGGGGGGEVTSACGQKRARVRFLATKYSLGVHNNLNTNIQDSINCQTIRGSRKFCQRGPTLTTFF